MATTPLGERAGLAASRTPADASKSGTPEAWSADAEVGVRGERVARQQDGFHRRAGAQGVEHEVRAVEQNAAIPIRAGQGSAVAHQGVVAARYPSEGRRHSRGPEDSMLRFFER